MTWLVRDDDVLAVAEVAGRAGARTRGLMGRDDVEGALVLRPCRQVHTFGMRFPIDVAFCDGSGIVLHLSTLGAAAHVPARVALAPSRSKRARAASNAGSCRPGDVVEIKG